MSVTPADVRHVATLARLGLDESTISALVVELNGILSHMDVLQQVEIDTVTPSAEDTAGGLTMPLRADTDPPVALHGTPVDTAPAARDGFFLVPRLDTHEAPGTGERA